MLRNFQLFKVKTEFTSIFIPDKYTRDIRINVNATSKKLKFYDFMVELYSGENAQKKWEKNNLSWASQCRIGKSHFWGQYFKQGFDKGSSLVDISTPRVRFPYPTWTFMMDSYIFAYPTGISTWLTRERGLCNTALVQCFDITFLGFEKIMFKKKKEKKYNNYNWDATWQNQQSDCMTSEDSDQPGHPPSLIRVFAVCSMGS